MTHARVVIVEFDEIVSVNHLVVGASEEDVKRRAAERLRQAIDEAVKDDPEARPSEDEYKTAMEHGNWWVELGSGHFTVMIQEPEAIEYLPHGPSSELQRQCGLVLDLADEEVHTRYQCARDGQTNDPGMQEARDLEADVKIARPYIKATPAMLDLLSQAICDWPQFEGDAEVCGGDLVEWFAEWRQRVKACLDDLLSQSGDQTCHAICTHLEKGFVVLTCNPRNPPGTRFEAWAYNGPLNFEQNESVRFGLSADPISAIQALDWHLAQ